MALSISRIAFIGLENEWCQEAATIVGDSEQMAATRLRTPFARERWRSTSAAAADTAVQLDLGQARPINAVVFHHENLQWAGKSRLLLSSTASHTGDVYDSGSAAYHSSQSYSQADWERWERSSVIYLLSDDPVLQAQYARLEFDDATNPDGFITGGRLLVDEAFQFSSNPKYATVSIAKDPVGRSRETLGLSRVADSVARRTVLSMSFGTVPENEALLDFLHRSFGRVGEDRPFYFLLEPDTPARWPIAALYCRFRSLTEVAHLFTGPQGRKWGFRAVLEEVL